MKRLAPLALAFALASSGCVHRQLTNHQVARTAVTVVSVAGLLLLLTIASPMPPGPLPE